MDELKNFSATDWLFFATMVIAWFYLLAKAYGWFIGILFRRCWRWWNRKDEKTLAMDSFYEAFRLAEIEPGQGVVITTESGMQIHILRPKGDRHA
ncbi:TPA: DUF4752 family protein [Enterobacter hormaechei subsp. xiangfangensis]|uniref:DUF4752 family protein n=1 Tax=Enterobacter cloacae complex TaxID=354276 RepID=UPI0029D23065|nr:DUF4752 family protein [Enterobacter hormaechei subsp. xiangfangensis]HEJ0064934.1 DUF4752 family protein [Citrobacter koseri]HEM8489970.1 DUF4752 family protein [Citrobacter koseri]